MLFTIATSPGGVPTCRTYKQPTPTPLEWGGSTKLEGWDLKTPTEMSRRLFAQSQRAKKFSFFFLASFFFSTSYHFIFLFYSPRRQAATKKNFKGFLEFFSFSLHILYPYVLCSLLNLQKTFHQEYSATF